MQPESLDRLNHPNMEYYRETYKNSERWNGVESLKDKTVIVYCEQGYGDNIQFARYFLRLKEEGCKKIYLHCRTTLHRLFEQFELELLDRDKSDIPEHDFHITSMSLPFHFENPDVEFPYIKVDEVMDLSELGLDEYYKIGIVWEGNPIHSNNKVRCCPLIKYKRIINTFPNVKLFTLQKAMSRKDLLLGAENLEFYAADIDDYYDTATLVNAMDCVVTVDTSVLHLVGAMNKRTFGLLSSECDPRWRLENINWYPNVKLIQQDRPKDWDGVFDNLMVELKKIIK